MAIALVQSSGLIQATGGSWTPATALTVNNLLTVQQNNDSSSAPGTADFKDSSGTPKTLARDVTKQGTLSATQASINSVVIPSGWTNPLKDGNAGFQNWMAVEWSGNATSSVLDTSNSSTLGTTSGNTGSINTGANAGLVLASMVANTAAASSNIVITGTNFTDTYTTTHDGTQQNDSANDGGACNYRLTSTASQTGLQDAWTFATSASGAAACIASYNAATGGAAAQTPYQPWYQRAPILAM